MACFVSSGFIDLLRPFFWALPGSRAVCPVESPGRGNQSTSSLPRGMKLVYNPLAVLTEICSHVSPEVITTATGLVEMSLSREDGAVRVD